MNLIHGMETLPRLVETMVPGRRRYRSLDDFGVRDAARRDRRPGASGV